MSLILHLMKKDAWYLRYELAIYGFLVVAQAGLILAGVDARVIDRQLVWLEVTFLALIIIRLIIAVVVVAQLIQCDPLPGTTAFWRTRPIPRSTLLATKLVLAALVFLALPFVIDVATLLALHMNLVDSLIGATVDVTRYLTLLLPAAALAVVTRDVAHYIVAIILVLVGLTPSIT